MNIFVLDLDPVVSAQMHMDKHCIKLTLEVAQLLSTAVLVSVPELNHEECGLYKKCYINHPCSIWTRRTRSNFNWLVRLGIALGDEYTFRYGKHHKSVNIIKTASEYAHYIPDGELTEFAQVMPEQYRGPDPVKAYRAYYLGEKSKIMTYTKRCVPYWVNGETSV